MVVILVLVTFLVFIALDYLLNRKKAIYTVGVEVKEPPALVGADYVDGFLVPENVSYHSGHSWVARERPKPVVHEAEQPHDKIDGGHGGPPDCELSTHSLRPPWPLSSS